MSPSRERVAALAASYGTDLREKAFAHTNHTRECGVPGSGPAGRAGLIAVCLSAFVMGAIGWSDEAYASLNGDMARYLMDGVFLSDLFVSDRPFGSPQELLDYARLYYARYPALSLGHHPVLLPLLEAPVFALFGASVRVARVVPLMALVAASLFLYRLVKRQYGTLPAVAAGALFVTSPMIVVSARSVMAEMPAIACALAGWYFLTCFFTSNRRLLLMAAAVAFTAAIYAKPQIVLLGPAVALTAVTSTSLRRVLRFDVIGATVAVGLVSAPALAVPLLMSHSNVAGVMSAAHLESRSRLLGLAAEALSPQLAWPAIALAALTVSMAAFRRDGRVLSFVFWIGSIAPALYFFSGAYGAGPRYTVYWIPAFCALAGAALATWRTMWIRGALTIVVGAAVVIQVRADHVITDRIEGIGGYEEAARFVVGAGPGPTVLFSGDVDTGYFSFFVRKHDPARRLVVLRADKIFTTSEMGAVSIKDHIERRDQIVPVLQRFGTRYVIIEDRPSQSRVLEWLREEVKSERFIERRRIPIRTTDRRLRGTSLAVFELRDVSPPAPDAALALHMPAVGQSLTVPLRDLIARKMLQ
jgi:hypothetical protein